jgi:hypothetical protein
MRRLSITRPDLSVLGAQSGGLAGDSHPLDRRADFHVEVDAQPVADLKNDSRPLQVLEPGRLGHEHVSARNQVGKVVLACRVALGFALNVGRDVLCSDRHIGHESTAWIGNQPLIVALPTWAASKPAEKKKRKREFMTLLVS